jgi:hypothetical protein
VRKGRPADPARRGAQDVAKMTLAALRTEKTVGQRITLAGPQAYTVSEVIALCERFANADADVTEARRPACSRGRSAPLACDPRRRRGVAPLVRASTQPESWVLKV